MIKLKDKRTGLFYSGQIVIGPDGNLEFVFWGVFGWDHASLEEFEPVDS